MDSEKGGENVDSEKGGESRPDRKATLTNVKPSGDEEYLTRQNAENAYGPFVTRRTNTNTDRRRRLEMDKTRRFVSSTRSQGDCNFIGFWSM